MEQQIRSSVGQGVPVIAFTLVGEEMRVCGNKTRPRTPWHVGPLTSEPPSGTSGPPGSPRPQKTMKN